MPSVARSTSAMPAASSHAEVKASITAYLTSKNVPPSTEWLRSFMPSIRLNMPIIALRKTALFRLLASDITQSVDTSGPSSVFPPGTSTPDVREKKLAGPITVQVLDVEDIGRSRWSQVESIEAQERGEMTKGREVIRVVDDETNTDNTATENAASPGPHKLLLQDAKGTKVYGLELDGVSGIGVQMAIGSKLVLRDATVARGVVLLEPRGVEILGGKVEAWEKKWRSERKDALKRTAGLGEGE